MIAPFAEYTLTEKPDWLTLTMRVGQALVLNPAEQMIVSRKPDAHIYVQADRRLFDLGWGGTRNHSITFHEGAWLVHHLGHHAPLWINDVKRVKTQRLEAGDRVSPAKGLVFTFSLRPDLELLAEELEQLKWPTIDTPVLADWLMERTGMDREAASRATEHFRMRSAASRVG